jgi:thiol reductant ABC exporter CydC subunit
VTGAERTGRGGGDLAPLRPTLALVRPALPRVLVATLLGAGAVAATIGLLATSAWLLSRAAQHPGESALGLAIVAVQFFGLSRGFLRYGERLVGHDAAFRLLADVRVRLYRALERLAPAGLPAFRRGDLLARTVHDVEALQDLPLRVVPPFGVALLAGGGAVALCAVLLPTAGLVLAAALALAAVAVPALSGRLARRGQAGEAAARGALSAAVVDLVEGAPELVAFGASGTQLDRVAAADAELTAHRRAAATTAGVGLALVTALTGLAMWGGVVLGVAAVGAGRLPGVDLAVLALVPLGAFEAVSGVPGATEALARVRASAARLFDILAAPAPLCEPSHPAPVGAGPHHLVLEGVRAVYPGRARPALDGVDLDLPPGRRVALVGPSGAGKSTLADVLVRFVDYQGSARLDGTELRHLAGSDVRAVVGLVPQEVHLFDTTLAENLRLAHREADDARLTGVLEQVGLGPWLAGLPAGLDTEVGERGTRLSGGQRRRVGLARALLAGVDVLVADEPGQHLAEDEADRLVADLLAARPGRTTVVVTHRLAPVTGVDEIVVLDRGRVTARGTHRELVARDPAYRARWTAEVAGARRAAGHEHREDGTGPTGPGREEAA